MNTKTYAEKRKLSLGSERFGVVAGYGFAGVWVGLTLGAVGLAEGVAAGVIFGLIGAVVGAYIAFK